MRIAFKGVAFLRLILTDVDYHRIIIKGLIIMKIIIIIIIIKRFWGINIIIIKGVGGVIMSFPNSGSDK